MSSPKKPFLPEHVATQIANQLPGQGPVHSGDPHGGAARGHGGGQGGGGQGVDRRTAAMPQAPVVTAKPNERTMMFSPGQGPGPAATPTVTPGKRAPIPTLMTSPVPEPAPLEMARWLAGPLLAGVVCVLTVWVAGMLSGPSTPTAKNKGHLRVSSDPEGATVIVDGKVQPQPTPTTIDGEIGATLHVGFKLDGYLDREADVFVGEGERPFRAKLEHREDVEPPAPDPEPVAPEVVPDVQPPRDERPRNKKDPAPKHDRTPSTDTPRPAVTGTGTLSVHVRPWAIVYVDGAKIRQTPVDAFSIGAGLHLVELVNEGIHKREKVTVEVRANGSEEIRRDWEK